MSRAVAWGRSCVDRELPIEDHDHDHVARTLEGSAVGLRLTRVTCGGGCSSDTPLLYHLWRMSSISLSIYNGGIPGAASYSESSLGSPLARSPDLMPTDVHVPSAFVTSLSPRCLYALSQKEEWGRDEQARQTTQERVAAADTQAQKEGVRKEREPAKSDGVS